MKTLNTHNEEMEKKFDEELTHIDIMGTRKIDMFCVTNRTKDDPIFPEQDEMVTKHKDFITSQNKQLYIKIADGELKRWNKEIEQISTGLGAIPETNDYANGWNDCRKEAYETKKHFVQEQILYWNNILQELNK